MLIHLGVLSRLSKWILRLRFKGEIKVALALLGALAAHMAEVMLFSGGYYFLAHTEHVGKLVGTHLQGFVDYGYYSIVTYTSLGLGDIVPKGELRILTGVEALTGLILIGWTTSFLFVEMQRFWERNRTGPY